MVTPPKPPDAAAAERPLLISTFSAGGALCGLETQVVEEVVRLRRPTRVARSPEYVAGVVNLRGKIVTVIDLARKLSLGALAPGDANRLYIVHDHGESVGLLVDRAQEVVELDPAAVEQPPANVAGAAGRFFRYMGRAGERVVAVLDPGQVLAV